MCFLGENKIYKPFLSYYFMLWYYSPYLVTYYKSKNNEKGN
jgi:hypothetical protein